MELKQSTNVMRLHAGWLGFQSVIPLFRIVATPPIRPSVR